MTVSANDLSFQTPEDYAKGLTEFLEERDALKETVEAQEEELEIYKKREAECNDKMTELAVCKKNMRCVLNMIEYTIGGYDDVSDKLNDILWTGADTTFADDDE